MLSTIVKYEITQAQGRKTVTCEFNVQFIERQKRRSKYLVQVPGARKNLRVIESHTTDTFYRVVKENHYL